jgi:hypothetical protein
MKIPMSHETTMNALQMKTAIKLRLGWPICSTTESVQCICGKKLDIYGDHIMTCKKGPEVHHRHNMLVQTWERLMRKTSQSSLALEKPLFAFGLNNPKHAGKRVEIAEFSSNRKTTLYDVSVIHSTPENMENIKKYGTCAGYPAETKEKTKNSKYKEHAERLGLQFIPLATESFGRMGDAATSLVHRMIEEYASKISYGGDQDKGLIQKLSAIWWSTLSCTLQRGNANIINFRMCNILQKKHTEKHGIHSFRIVEIMEYDSF